MDGSGCGCATERRWRTESEGRRRSRRRGALAPSSEASPGPHLPFNALLPFVFFSLCDTAIVVPSYTVYYLCLSIFVSAWVATAHSSRVKRPIPKTRLRYSWPVRASHFPRLIAENYPTLARRGRPARHSRRRDGCWMESVFRDRHMRPGSSMARNIRQIIRSNDMVRIIKNPVSKKLTFIDVSRYIETNEGPSGSFSSFNFVG